jgi:hypothetical protein
VDFTRDKATKPATGIPAFYEELARKAGPDSIIEAPCDTRWDYTRAYYVYQNLHGKDVHLSCPEYADAIDPRRFQLTTLIDPAPEALLASGAGYLVLHGQLPAEEEQIAPPRHGSPADERLLHRAASTLSKQLRAVWGPPDFTQGSLQIWDLVRLRGQTPLSFTHPYE